MNPRDREFDYLRKEIEFCTAQKQTIFNLIYVSVATILAWAISIKSPFICILTYCVSFPYYCILMSYNIAIFKIQAYFYVFFEENLWDKRKYEIDKAINKNFNQQDTSYKFPFIFVNIMSTVLSLMFLCQSYSIPSLIATLISMILLLIFVGYIHLQKSHIETIENYIKIFNDIKIKENADKN